jgi:large subunit ribosomal protein L3
MAKLSRPRRGSLQYWPRKRAASILPSANWNAISLKNNNKLLGFLGYKVGMLSAYAKDMTPDSMTKTKRITFPVTIIECPGIKIFSVRFYKNGQVASEMLATNLDKELKRAVKLPKSSSNQINVDAQKNYDDIRVIVYSLVKKTGIKKKPDMAEIALGGNVEDKLNFVKSNVGKEIRVAEILEKMQLVDIRGVTKGFGLEGAVKRYGIGLRSHKAEKGRRRPGSLGPWHPSRVTFRTPMAGQTGMFTRVIYNNKIVDVANIKEKDINPKGGFNNFGTIKTDYIAVRGSIQGPQKRVVMITLPLRKTKYQDKKNFELIDFR